MKKIIKDIRLYKSETGASFSDSFTDKKLNAIIMRIVMKLREKEFSLGEFDHIYIIFTTRDIPKKMVLSNEVDRYHPWYRSCTVSLEKDIYNNLGAPETYECIINSLNAVLTTYFTTDDFDKTQIINCITQAVELGKNMLIKYKEKITSKRKAIILLRYLDTCMFRPLLRIYDTEDNLLFEKDLPETLTLDSIGNIQVSTKQITIKPKKNAFMKQEEPVIFVY